MLGSRIGGVDGGDELVFLVGDLAGDADLVGGTGELAGEDDGTADE